jgi:hypothetical protein
MQTQILKILLFFLFPLVCCAQQEDKKVEQADSLFRAKQYTQSYAIYHNLLLDKKYTDAMLLKMAFIQEGLGHHALCLYYLNLYMQASDDQQTEAKMEEFAEKHRLEGYQTNDQTRAIRFFHDHSIQIRSILFVLTFFFFALLIYLKKKDQSLVAASIMVLLFSTLLFMYSTWGNEPAFSIISSTPTYIMNGPSAGASVIAIVEEGHRVKVVDKKDVWLKVQWRDKDAFIKESNVLPVKL